MAEQRVGATAPVPEQDLPAAERYPQPADRHKKRPGRVFLVAFVVLFLAMACWSYASPLFAAPDEPVHVMKAAALVRGELTGDLSHGLPSSPLGLVSLPKFFAVDRKVPACFHTAPTVPANCAPSAAVLASPRIPPSGVRCPPGTAVRGQCSSFQTFIYNARYPPLYYAIVGLPSLIGAGNAIVYLMRLVSAVISAALLALAVMTACTWSCRRTVLLGVVVASSPMVLYLGGVVNPSGLEISAAISFWTAGVVLVREHLQDPPLGLVVSLFVSASVFECVRGLSPFWLALSALVLVGLSDLGAISRFVRHRSVQVGLAVTLLFGLFAVGYIVHQHTLDVFAPNGVPKVPAGTSELTILETSFARNDSYLLGMIGVFGSFDTFSPQFSYVAWYLLAGLLGLGAAITARLRELVVVLCFALAIFVLPVIISSSQAHKYGFTWSGRDTLPLAVGLPIVAAALFGEGRLLNSARRLAAVVMSIAVVAQFAAFFEALRRYTVGTAGSDFGFVLHPLWKPPLGVLALLIGEAAVLVAAGVLVTVALANSPARRTLLAGGEHNESG